MHITAFSTGICGYCGGYHTSVCPLIDTIEYYKDGTIKSVKFRDPVPVYSPPHPETPDWTPIITCTGFSLPEDYNVRSYT